MVFFSRFLLLGFSLLAHGDFVLDVSYFSKFRPHKHTHTHAHTHTRILLVRTAMIGTNQLLIYPFTGSSWLFFHFQFWFSFGYYFYFHFYLSSFICNFISIYICIFYLFHSYSLLSLSLSPHFFPALFISPLA